MLGVPYQPHSQTSRAAALALAGKAQTMEARVLAYIDATGAHGCTDEELFFAMVKLNPGVKESTVRARRVGLFNRGLVSDVIDAYRPTKSGRLAQIWIAT